MPIVEHGSNLSAGERQLLCLARLLLKPAKLYICDEATACVDPAADTIIHDTLLALPSTVLFICHRLEVCRAFRCFLYNIDNLGRTFTSRIM